MWPSTILTKETQQMPRKQGNKTTQLTNCLRLNTPKLVWSETSGQRQKVTTAIPRVSSWSTSSNIQIITGFGWPKPQTAVTVERTIRTLLTVTSGVPSETYRRKTRNIRAPRPRKTLPSAGQTNINVYDIAGWVLGKNPLPALDYPEKLNKIWKLYFEECRWQWPVTSLDRAGKICTVLYTCAILYTACAWGDTAPSQFSSIAQTRYHSVTHQQPLNEPKNGSHRVSRKHHVPRRQKAQTRKWWGSNIATTYELHHKTVSDKYVLLRKNNDNIEREANNRVSPMVGT